MTELQNSIAEAKSLKNKINEAIVQKQMMKISVEVLWRMNETLAVTRDNLVEEK